MKKREITFDFYLNEKSNSNKAINQLQQIGFTGNSLQLKAKLLNKLWKDVIEEDYSISGKMIDFAQKKIVKLVRKFLHFLNSVLNSLKLFLPPLDAIKEVKEVMENYLKIADE